MAVAHEAAEINTNVAAAAVLVIPPLRPRGARRSLVGASVGGKRPLAGFEQTDLAATNLAGADELHIRNLALPLDQVV